MKGLKNFPSKNDFQGAYDRLQSGARLTSREFTRFALWSRLDPRLAEIVTQALARDWNYLSPVMLHHYTRKSPWPQALPALLEFSRILIQSSATKKDLGLFSLWQKTVIYRIPPARNQQFYIAIDAFGGLRMRSHSHQNLFEFERWGYMSCDAPLNKNSQAKKPANLTPLTRNKILQELMDDHDLISVNLYLKTLNFAITRRQAERDLASKLELTPKGHTRSRVYVVNKGK